MACNTEFRHVCLKDLENYVKRDLYFSDFSDEEIEVIKENLGLNKITVPEYNPTVAIGTYDTIYKRAKAGELKVGYIYVIKDFRSLYLDEADNLCGTDDYVPSKEYRMYLRPISETTFHKNVTLIATDTKDVGCEKWIVEYDITPETLTVGTQSKGKITFLKDTNNNYAYYDFKNIKFLKTYEELKKGPNTYKSNAHLYTFDCGGTDASETTCCNNHLEYKADRNVFLGSTQNVTLQADCHDNIFFKSCENCTFGYGTYSNYFKDDVFRCNGVLHEKELDSVTAKACPKWFSTLEAMEVIIYLDPETMSFQVEAI